MTRHEIWYDRNGTIRSDDVFHFSMEVIDGKIRIDVSQFGEGYMWLKLKSADHYIWRLLKQFDKDMDGTIDPDSKLRSIKWYLFKPENFTETNL